MKAPAKKVVPPKPAPKDLERTLDSYESRIIDLGVQLDTLEKEAYPKVEAIIRGALPKMESLVGMIIRGHADRIEDNTIKNVFEILKAEPVWETKFVPGAQSSRHEVESLYRQGWRYLTSCVDQKTNVGGTLFHRPKLPTTLEEFTAMYKTIVESRKKTEESLKKREAYYAEQAKKAAAKQSKAADEATPVEEAEPVEAEAVEAEAVPVEETPVKTPAKKLLVKLAVRRKS